MWVRTATTALYTDSARLGAVSRESQSVCVECVPHRGYTKHSYDSSTCTWLHTTYAHTACKFLHRLTLTGLLVRLEVWCIARSSSGEEGTTAHTSQTSADDGRCTRVSQTTPEISDGIICAWMEMARDARRRSYIAYCQPRTRMVPCGPMISRSSSDEHRRPPAAASAAAAAVTAVACAGALDDPLQIDPDTQRQRRPYLDE